MSAVTRPRRLLLARPRGYCAGVERAVETVEQMLVLHGPPIYVRKQIVHNIHVVRRLEQQGAIFVESEEDVPEGATVVLSAHGVAPEVHRNAALRRLRAIDATCPLVTKVHNEAQALRRPGPHDLPDRPRRATRKWSARWARRPTRSCSCRPSRTSRCCRSRRASNSRTSPRRRSRSTRRPTSSPRCRRRFPTIVGPPEGRHLLRHDEPPGGRQVTRARGRSRARDRLGELVELAAPGRRDARPGRARAPDRRRIADPRQLARRASRPSASPPARRRPNGSSSASWTGSASAASRKSPSTT